MSPEVAAMTDVLTPLPTEFTRRARAALEAAMRLADEAARLTQEYRRIEAGYNTLVGPGDYVGSKLVAYEESDVALLDAVLLHTRWVLDEAAASCAQPLWDIEAARLEARFGWVAPLPPGEGLGCWEAVGR